MQSLNLENIHQFKDSIDNKILVLYGCASFGQRSLNILNQYSIKVDFFADDDINKQGTKVMNVPVISFEKLKELTEKNSVNVILTSIYFKPILTRLNQLSLDVYEMSSMLSREDITKMMTMKQSHESWQSKWKIVREYFSDKESIDIWNLLNEVETTRKIPTEKFTELSSAEPHYFVKQVKDLLNERSIIVDCGAYTGDIFSSLNNIDFGKIYSIEAEPDVYKSLLKNVNAWKFSAKVIPLNVGVYDSNGEMNFWFDKIQDAAGYLIDSANDITGGGGIKVSIRKLDDIIHETIDLLKMDIEGAELPALKGGKNLILQSRPILTISIYHSFDDLVDIPIYLHELLNDYKFFLKHHSFTLGETVLYGLPLERLKM